MTLPELMVYRGLGDLVWDGWKKTTAYIDALSDKKLWRLREAVEAMGQTNCGWLPYRLKADLLQHIDWQMKKREEAKAR